MDTPIQAEALTPQAYRRKGADINIVYGFHDTSFGECMIANSTQGICMLDFIDDNRDFILKRFHNKWINSHIEQDQKATARVVASAFGLTDDSQPPKVLMMGTPFQLKIWNILLHIPYGQQTTYSAIAQQINQPKAARAVGSAIAQNHIAYLVPCHRVLRTNGGLADYKWSKNRKTQLLELFFNLNNQQFLWSEKIKSR